jgi:adenosylhomocysteine nucleosidase
MIGLMSAMEEELVRFRESLELDQVVKQAGIDFYFGQMAGQKVVLLKCGVGKVNAAVATQLLIDRFGVDGVIFSGLAGGLVGNLRRGDIVVSNFVVQYDIDLTAFGRRPGEIPDLARMIEASPRLVRVVADAADEVIQHDSLSRQMVVGTIATGDSFVASPDKVRWMQREFGAVAVEMEGGAVGQVCQMNRVPFVVVRVISDSSSGSAAGEFIMFLDEASAITSKIIHSALHRLAAKATDRQPQAV